MQGDGGSHDRTATRVELGGGFAVTHSLVNEDGAVLAAMPAARLVGQTVPGRSSWPLLGRKLAAGRSVSMPV
ncbi:MAG: hypothetical protein R3D03_14100 [Geminicoccaceae bacterium]